MKVIEALAGSGPGSNAVVEADVPADVRRLCAAYPIYVD
jgi:hypothetical protein